MMAAAIEGSFEGRRQVEGGTGDERGEGEGDPAGATVDHRHDVVERSDDQEVLHGPTRRAEVAAGQQDEGVAGVQLDVAELALDGRTRTVDGDGGGPVPGAAAHLLEGAPDQR